MEVRQVFRDVLYAHPEAGGYLNYDFDELFSAAFAQTLAFGLLLVREAMNAPVGRDAWQHMPEEHPLMRTTLRVLSEPEVVNDIAVGFDVLCDTVNSFAQNILALRPNRRDPILYFYEDFLGTFDPEEKKKFGVYYTPVEVVDYMVGALDRALRNLRTEGLRDPTVTILDPAAGTGTFLLGIAQRVREAEAAGGAGMAALALQGLAHRMFGFELLVGPYAVAHYRLHHTLRESGERGERGERLELPRLGIYLADTLAEPGAAAAAGALGFVARGIEDERTEANYIKSQREILAIIANPPYRRLAEGEDETLVGRWMNELWDDLKEPVRNAGQGNQLNTFPELSVAFWRWAIWKIFEAEHAPGRGVVAFISNRKFLTGWPYAGLRQMMRHRFDRIEIFDLRGDLRRGERGDVVGDEGVFNIQVGTAITIAIADGSKTVGEAADVFYADSWTEGLFSRDDKFRCLRNRAEIGTMPNAIPVERDWLDDMRPEPFQGREYIGLNECFIFDRGGVQTKRDELVYDPVEERLTDRIRRFLSVNVHDAQRMFHDTRDRTWTAARMVPFNENYVTRVIYRPLDRRYLYNQSAYCDFLKESLQKVWGRNNLGLYAMPFGTGAGPAAWCHSLLPDYHAFSGRGGYAFPLYDRRPDVDGSNIFDALPKGLTAAYGAVVSPEEAFDAMLCVLSAWSYSRRFAEDLEDTFPHVVFPTQVAVFQNAVRIGREIRAVETFAREPRGVFESPNFVGLETQPRGLVAPSDAIGETINLCEDGSGRITGLPQAVWNFTVSGYRVLPRWLSGRAGLPADLALVREFRNVCGRIAELIELFREADIVLEAILNDSLNREALHFDAAPQGANDGRD